MNCESSWPGACLVLFVYMLFGLVSKTGGSPREQWTPSQGVAGSNLLRLDLRASIRRHPASQHLLFCSPASSSPDWCSRTCSIPSVVPGGSRTSLGSHIVSRRASRPSGRSVRGRRRGLSTAFAPFVLVSSFIIWMALLALASADGYSPFRAHFRAAPDELWRRRLSRRQLAGDGRTQSGESCGNRRWIVLWVPDSAASR